MICHLILLLKEFHSFMIRFVKGYRQRYYIGHKYTINSCFNLIKMHFGWIFDYAMFPYSFLGFNGIDILKNVYALISCFKSDIRI